MFESFPARAASRPVVLTAAAVLGVLSAFSPAKADAFLFDFGAAGTPTTGGQSGDPVYWNDVPASVGGTDTGVVPNLVLTNGTPTDIIFQMVSRFNGANDNGTQAHPQLPPSATRDSLFGNTEIFSELENITPIFQLQGLDTTKTYTLTFYASRTGVTDNRETRYTITGAAESTLDLNVANNVSTTVTSAPITPDANGAINIALTPGPNNNNGNHFTYLGILQIDISGGDRLLIDLGGDGAQTQVFTPVPSAAWNNITDTIGMSPTGTLTDLVTTNGTATTAGFAITARFNAANTAGATTSTIYPTTATQDSLFGNTESFNNLSNIRPEFKLTGLDPNFVYSFVFYAARAGVSDNRETRYTVTGANSAFGDLNASGNVDNTVAVNDIRPTAAGEITVALAPTPNNNNNNHFTYLNVMQVNFKPFRLPRLLIDFGSPTFPTALDTENAWNNITTLVGSSDTASQPALLLTDGTPTTIALQMVSRFNGANENGTQESALYPITATRDSLYGNTSEFGGLSNVTPIFKLTGLSDTNQYDFVFYASRSGVGDNRETRYTVTGVSESFVDLNAANNIDETVSINDVTPTAAGEITIALTPGPNNNNSTTLFTYLGVLQVDWTSGPVRPKLSEPSYANTVFSFRLTGEAGQVYRIQRTRDFTNWTDVIPTLTLSGESQVVTVPAQTEDYYFYQAVRAAN